MTNISVIIPVYNTEKYLDECIKSVLNQTYQDFELILVDDHSTDNSPLIIKKYLKQDSRIKAVTNKNSHGAGGARNTGIELSSGKYLAFLDSDDYYLPNFLEKMLLTQKQNDTDIVISYYYNLFNENTFIDKLNFNYGFEPLNLFSKKSIPKYLFNVVSYPIWNRLYKKDYLTKYNLYFEEVLCGEDGLFNTLSTFLADKIELLQEPLIVHRIAHSTTNLSSLCNTQNYNQTERILIQLQALKKYKASKEIIQSLINLWLENAYNHKKIFPYMQEKNSYITVFSEIKKHLKLYPPGYIYNKKTAQFMFALKLLPVNMMWYLEKLIKLKSKIKQKIYAAKPHNRHYIPN